MYLACKLKQLYIKEFKIYKNDINVWIPSFTAVFITIIYRYANLLSSRSSLMVGIMLLVLMSGVGNISIMIFDEKGNLKSHLLKIDLKTKYLVLVSKILFVFTLIIFTSIIVTFAAGLSIRNIPVILVVSIITGLFFIGLGIIVGIIHKNKATMGISMVPISAIYLLFGLSAKIGIDIGIKFNYLFPSYQLIEILDLTLDKNYNFSDIIFPFGKIFLMILLVFTAILLLIKVKKSDFI